MIIPSYYMNIKQYFAIMRYWWRGNRFQGTVEVDKMAPEVKARIKKNEEKIDKLENGVKEKLINKRPLNEGYIPLKRGGKVVLPKID
jgi:hypothetical protein